MFMLFVLLPTSAVEKLEAKEKLVDKEYQVQPEAYQS